jgi:translation initiation factor 2B subunit (eIF-2B alpha/beta/delta family)
MKDKKTKFNKILKDIKSVKIQGARNVALAGFKAYKLNPSISSKNKILKLRPTEPMLANILKKADKITYFELKNKLNKNQEIINKQVYKIIKNNYVVFTHCHSSNVINSLIYTRKKNKFFEVYNTETRPLYQGRKTAGELKKSKIKVTMFIDSAISIALTNSQGTRDVDLILLGADAILKKGIINKVGSNVIAHLAKVNKIPLYIVADSLKYSNKKTEIEQRHYNEVWDTQKNIKIKNPAFEFVDKKYITGIISELGNLSYNEFLRKIKKI